MDYNGKTKLGVSLTQLTQDHGLRVTAEKAYLRKVRNRKNLDIWINSLVTKIIFEKDSLKVKGVELIYKNSTYTVNVKKEVLVAADAYNSPFLLMKSGIGPKKQLQNEGIEVRKNLPVGKYLGNTFVGVGLFISVNDSKILPSSDLYKSAFFNKMV